ncbi:MAG TPA: hypothetical protein VD833_06705 [Vicinamibacterales bacterium]|nr:hypothetical protein [Vicinamibacterales bacterium]
MLGRLAAVFVLATMAGTAGLEGSTRYDPRLRFRTISTSRFHIHYHQGEEAEARRLAVIAERVAARLDTTLGPPSGRVHVVLVDQTDLSNGWATPVPLNLIEITAAAPDPASSIGNTDDWLEMVFAHEYTHVVHLSRSAGWIGGLRKAFGRMPLLFPNLYLPLWQIEGLATFQESAVTRQGRVPAGDFRAILDTAAARSRVDPIDRANGGLVDWPSGNAAYLYGAYFHEYLAGRFGAESLSRLTDETARRLPYLGAPAFKRVFGESLGNLWDGFAAHAAREADVPESAPIRLTRHGFIVTAPRFGPDGRLFYSVVNPHGFPALLAQHPGAGEPVRIANRYLGDGIGFAGRHVIFDQAEIVNQVGLQSDLYAVDADGGPIRRLTREARAADPDVSPDGVTIVCTLQRHDRRDLATFRWMPEGGAAVPDTLVSEAGTHFSSPRWSPDGRWIAAERSRAGAPSEIVLVDPVTARVVRTLPAPGRGRSVTPAWTPDGALLFAADPDGRGFRIFSSDVEGLEIRRLAGTGPNAQFPTTSRDGGTLAFVGYTTEGHDLFSLELNTARWDRVSGLATAAPAPREEPVPDQEADRDRAYAAWRWLAPRFWSPTLESDVDELVIGAATGAADVLGRHYYAAEAGWTAERARPDWQVAYAYDRWWPALFGSIADDTDPHRGGLVRTVEINAGALLPVRRVRWSQSLLAAFHGSTDTVECATCAPPLDARIDRRALRAGWSLHAARGFGYSISLEEGWRATVSTELVREALGSDADSGSAVADFRGYLPAWPRHGVIAGRIAAATSWGDDRTRREFSAAGNGPQPGGYRFGFDAVGLLRGVDEDDVTGSHAAVLNLDYRLPLARIDRGAGTWPIFVRALHGALFADVGHAWSGRFVLDDVRFSTGAELSVDAVVGFVLPLTLTTGVAWRETTAGDRGLAAFGRIGRAF